MLEAFAAFIRYRSPKKIGAGYEKSCDRAYLCGLIVSPTNNSYNRYLIYCIKSHFVENMCNKTVVK
ncbi:MAG: hypothetical protein U0W24_20525 [Bacteroidales bacterium]